VQRLRVIVMQVKTRCRLGDRAAGLVGEHDADFQLLEKTARHASLLRGGRMVTFQTAMSDATSPGTATCARCDTTLAEGDRVVAATGPSAAPATTP